jgi:hypothetical protein
MIDPFRCNLGYHFLKCVELLKFIGFLPECEVMSGHGCLAPSPLNRGDAPWPSSLIGWAISQQYAERQEWPDRNELLVH